MPSRHDSIVHLDVDASAAAPRTREREARERTPSSVSVLLLGDFTGRGGTGEPTGSPAAPVAVDRDTVDDALGAFRPSVSLGGGEGVTFRTLDDLHPDALLNRVPALGAVLDGRDPGATERGTDADGGGAWTGAADPGPAPGVLDAILDQASPGSSPPPSSDGPLDSIRAFAAAAARRDAAGPSEVGADGRRERAAHALRAFLRLPSFRALERRWRAVDFIVRRLDTGPRLHVYLADLSREALAAEIEAEGGIAESALARLLASGAGPEGEPWTYVALLDGAVGPAPADQVLLAWTTALCAAHGATLLVDGTPALAGIGELDDFSDPAAWTGVDEAWSAFRSQPEARSVAVALPGFLLRVPYGPDTDPVEALPSFDEVPERPRRDDYLFGPAAGACVVALARAHLRDADGRPPDWSVEGLPLHMWSDGVDRGVTAGAVAMTDGASRRLLEAGIVPVAWSRGGEAVRLLVPRTAGGTALP